MSHVPRASLSITILKDQDLMTIMELPDGAAIFGRFVLLVLVGRERLVEGRASRVDGTDSLRLDDQPRFIARMIHCQWEDVERVLEAFDGMAKVNGGEPWVTRDDLGKLVIRSFYKFNTSDNRGGVRDGAGRPSGNQKESNGNQKESNGIQSRNQSVSFEKPSSSSSSSSSFSIKTPPTPSRGDGVPLESAAPPKAKVERFAPPTLEEVTAYCAERKSQVDPRGFHDWYESVGWRTKAGPIKNWRACVRTWEARKRDESLGSIPLARGRAPLPADPSWNKPVSCAIKGAGA